VYTKLTDQSWEGEVVLGVPHDIVYPTVPSVLKRMGRTHPRVRVQLISSYTRELKTQFQKGEVDVILTTESGRDTGAETLLETPLRWIGAPDGQAWKTRPLKLAFCRDCMFRAETIDRLDEAGIAWDLAVDSASDMTVDATVSADLAVTTRLDGHAGPQLEYIDVGNALPDLGAQNINLYMGAGKSGPVEALGEYLREGMAALRAA
jgi:DNA-binding transcriptional LysR family regulator